MSRSGRSGRPRAFDSPRKPPDQQTERTPFFRASKRPTGRGYRTVMLSHAGNSAVSAAGGDSVRRAVDALYGPRDQP
jgi:hypothetical protein